MGVIIGLVLVVVVIMVFGGSPDNNPGRSVSPPNFPAPSPPPKQPRV